ncbi:DUTP-PYROPHOSPHATASE-LIKE 1 [Perilla frutescens var. frutescens]|nr:DUTP-PYROPHOSPHATASE-LIKE 1 [Perilla frutescens var. frutescens]
MAGTIAAIFQKLPTLPRISPPFNPHSAPIPTLIRKFLPFPNRGVHSISLNMAQAAAASAEANHAPEIEEPAPKIQKIHDSNGVCETKPSEIAPFLRVKKLSEKAILPSRASPLSAGYDLSSAAETRVPARGKALVPTDLSIAVPEGTYARIAPRSGLAWKHSIDVGAGVVDADYRGPVGVILFNHSDVDFEVKAGDRVAQLIIEKIVTPEVAEVDDLDSTARGDGGFGSTGV